MNINQQSALVVENAPLGIDAANTAGIQSLVLLNNSPLSKSDFEGKIYRSRIFKDTVSISAILSEWCN
jgi:beta-phosphoglucomutase-like phosphatase (HAD superfamily)